MKILALLITLFTSICVFSQGEEKLLCKAWEKIIEPDMQMSETIFTKTNADQAQTKLASLDKKSEDIMVQFAFENFTRIVKGYKLRTKALETSSAEDIANFCEFYLNEAFYHD